MTTADTTMLILAALVNLSLIAIGALVIRDGYSFGYALIACGVICGARVTRLMRATGRTL